MHKNKYGIYYLMIICGAHGRLSMGIRHLRIICTDRNRSSWTIETDLHDTLTSHTEWIINYMKCNSDPGRLLPPAGLWRSSNLVAAAGYRKIRACSSTTRYSRRTIPILVRYSTLHGALLKKSLEMITPTRWLKKKKVLTDMQEKQPEQACRPSELKL